MCQGHTQMGALCSTDREPRFAEEMTGPGLWVPQGSSPGCRAAMWCGVCGQASPQGMRVSSGHMDCPLLLWAAQRPWPTQLLSFHLLEPLLLGLALKLGGCLSQMVGEGPAGAEAGPGRMVEGPWGANTPTLSGRHRWPLCPHEAHRPLSVHSNLRPSPPGTPFSL